MPYPVSDHCDGTRFFNPEPSNRPSGGRRMGLFSYLRARLRRDPSVWSQWPKHVENKPYPAPAGLVPDGTVDVTFIGHSSFLLRLPGLTVLTDPIFSKRCSPFTFAGPKRVRDPGIALDALPPIDLTLISHNHYDHLDLRSLRRLRKRFPAMQIAAPLGNAAFLAGKRIGGAIDLDWWQTHQFEEARATLTPARHFAARWLNDRNETLWGGFMLEHRGTKIYFAGDTGYTRFFTEIRRRLGAPDIALLPIGAYEPRWFMQTAHMNPADAVQAFRELEPRIAIGMHFGTFQLTAEPIDQPEKDLFLAKAEASVKEDGFITLDVGETRRVLNGSAPAG